MEKNKYIKPLLFFFMLTLLINLFTVFMNKRAYDKEDILRSKKEEYNKKTEELNKIKYNLNTAKETYDNLSGEFQEKFGYDYNLSQEEELRNFSMLKKNENKDILDNLRKLVKNYHKYYDGSIYTNEIFDSTMSNFTSLSEDINYEQYKDIVNDLKINKFIDEANDGAIFYLKNKNADKKDLTLYLFIYAYYSSALKFFSENENIPLYELYASVVNLENLCKKMEDLSYKLGDLNSENLGYLKNNIYELMKTYYGNLGILNSLE